MSQSVPQDDSPGATCHAPPGAREMEPRVQWGVHRGGCDHLEEPGVMSPGLVYLETVYTSDRRVQQLLPPAGCRQHACSLWRHTDEGAPLEF